MATAPHKSVPSLLHVGTGMVARRLVVRAKDVAFLKGIVEAHEGLAQVFAEGGGDLTLAAGADRAAELDALVHDLALEFNGIVGDAVQGSEAAASGPKAEGG